MLDDSSSGTGSSAEVVSNHAPNVITIVRLAVATQPGDFIPDDMISRETGAPITLWSSSLPAAMSLLLSEYKIALHSDRKRKGYWHLRDGELGGASERKVRQAKRRAKAGLAIARSVKDYASLTREEQSDLFQAAALASSVLDGVSKRSRRELERKVANGVIDTTDVKLLMGGKI